MKAKIENMGKYALLVGCIGMFLACGGGGGGGGTSSTPPAVGLSGTVVQGVVSGAKVWADHKSGAEANFKMDASEAATATVTAADGTFTLATTPAYDYICVSSGGVDSITGKPAQQTLAPAGANVLSPFTTLVAMDSAAAAVLNSLGVDSASNVSTNVTPAALLLLQSIQAVQTALMEALDPGHNKLTEDQVTSIQRAFMTALVALLKNQTAAQLDTPATLTATLQAAMTNALNSIIANPANSNITMVTTTAAFANSVVTANLINTIATAIVPGSTANTAFSTASADAKAENVFITPAKATTIDTTCDNTASTASANCNVVPKTNQPPVISGTPATSVVAGTAYSFTPTASDPNGDSLTFSIANKPGWASFSILTGMLSGTPAAANVGSYSGIVISVTDGIAVVSLPAFSITVSPVTGATGSGGGTL